MTKWSGIRDDRQIGGIFAKAIVGDVNGVIACGYCVELKFAFVVGHSFSFPIRTLAMQLKVSCGDGAMLHIVNDAAHRAENAGERWADNTYRQEQREKAITNIDVTLHERRSPK